MVENKSTRTSNKVKQDRQVRLAQALRKNLRRRKVPQTPISNSPTIAQKEK